MIFNRINLLRTLVAVSSMFCASFSCAEIGIWQELPHARARLLSSEKVIGFEIELDPEWKIYWSYAGPVGQPTEFISDHVEFFFPWPKRGELQGFPSYGYEDRVLFPGLLTNEGGQLTVALAICSATQCIPTRANFDLPNSVDRDELVLDKVSKALLSIPRPVLKQPSFVIDQQRQLISLDTAQRSDFILEADAEAARAGFFLETAQYTTEGLQASYLIGSNVIDLEFIKTARVFTNGPGGPEVHDPTSMRSYDKLQSELNLTDGAIYNQNDVESLPRRSLEDQYWISIFGTAVLMFVGGLLLNVMPCVLPIVFLKLSAFTSRSTADSLRELRTSFGWTAFGIVGTFTLTGIGLAVAQILTGIEQSLGAWMQFPQTTVVLGVAVVLFIANSFGWYEFALPSSLSQLGLQKKGRLGDVLAGVVAALMGGACAGVLLAAALAVAFSSGGVTLVALLTTMGVGLALPYILVALMPGFGSLIPKPGPWISWVKPIIGVGLVLTLAYIFLIAAHQITQLALLIFFLGCVLSLLAFRASKWRRWSLVILLLMVFLVPRATQTPDPLELARNYQREIDELVSAGNTVLVDVTAYWCATCLTNKALVLDTEKTRILLEGYKAQIFTINADLMADNVSEFMSLHGRNALPLNLIFGPNLREGEILPSILTIDSIRAALDRSL